MPGPSPHPLIRCCPLGYAYIDSTGFFMSPELGYVSITNPDITPFVGKCSTIANHTWAILPSDVIDFIPCPCCPEGYTYDDISGKCQSAIATIAPTLPIPCLPCVCVDPPPPQECVGCQSSSGGHVHFAYNPFIKTCVDCNPQDFNLTNDPKLNCFMPYFLILPNTNTFNLEP